MVWCIAGGVGVSSVRHPRTKLAIDGFLSASLRRTLFRICQLALVLVYQSAVDGDCIRARIALFGRP